MPAKDRYHEIVKRALTKAGWLVDAEQLAMIIEDRRLWIDLRATKSDQHLVVLVEVKGFENMASPVEYLANTAGQYALYRSVLDYLALDLPLYLAVPEAAYNGILAEAVGQQLLRRVEARLIVFDPDREEVVQWID